MRTQSVIRGLRPTLLSALFPLGLVAGVLLTTSPAAGQTGSVVRVEEDWRLVVGEPNTLVEAPQFQTVMSAFDNTDQFYALVIWNYRELPEFAAGGLQLQSWYGDWRLQRRSVKDQVLSTTAETITWTQALWTQANMLWFEIYNGHSITWGDFGKDMKIYEWAFLPDLNAYTSEQSVKNSWITHGANRVDLLVIERVRYIDDLGLVVWEDSTPKVVYQRPATGG